VSGGVNGAGAEALRRGAGADARRDTEVRRGARGAPCFISHPARSGLSQ
jgi:hypothetical protein